jgi:glycogen debranching enzyme
MDTLRQQAAELLRSNDCGSYTLPSPHLYPHQWAWDSAFAAIGWLHVDPDRAIVELETLLGGQWDDGRIPHITFHIDTDDYFPGPDFWGTADNHRTSTITNPPVWTIAAKRIWDAGEGRERIEAMIEDLERSHVFFAEQRDPNGWGLAATVHPWENGLDNSPAWDEPMSRVDTTGAPEFKRVDTDKVEDASQRPTDEDYAVYTTIVKSIEEDGFGPGCFAVYDPFMSAMLLRAEHDLAALAEEAGVTSNAAERADRVREGLGRLWDDDAGRYAFHDVHADLRYSLDVLPAYAPLFADPELPGSDRMREILKTRYWTKWPLPTASPEADCYDPNRYWRGPTWVNQNWLFAPVLGDELVQKTLALVQREGFREYYHPETGAGLGATDFTWTAALVLDL